MTDFAVELRHRCRNPLCRCKLPEPVANKREAFCTRGCYGSFYLHRCRVCEEPIEQPKHGTRLICKKSKCQNEWKTGLGFGRFAELGQASINSNPAQEVPVNGSGLGASKAPWRQVAGPPLSPSQFRCATLAGSALDEVLRIEAKNRALLRAAEQAEIEANGYFTDPGWRAVVSADGVRCFVAGTDRRGDRMVAPLQRGELAIPDDLSIPEFLRRNGGGR